MLYIRLSYEYTPKDYLQFLKYHYSHTINGFIAIAIGIGALSFFAYKALSGDSIEQWVFGIGLIVMFLFYCNLYFYRGIQIAKKAGTFGLCHLEITEDQITTQSPVSGMSISWHLVHRIIEQPQMYLVYVKKTAAITIPKRAFSSEEEHKQWREQIVLLSKKEIQ